MFEDGMAYVALIRVCTLDGVAHALMMCEKVNQWCINCLCLAFTFRLYT